MRVTGSCLSHRQLRLLRAACDFCADELGIPKKHRHKIWVTVRRKEFALEPEENWTWGMVDIPDYKGPASLKNRGVVLMMNGDMIWDTRSWLETLAHEFVHVHQCITRRLYLNKSDLVFEGKRYGFDKISLMTLDEYNNLPWEREARANERKLCNKMVKEIPELEDAFAYKFSL